MKLEQKIIEAIRNVPDFPKPGIQFKDISTILLDPFLCQEVLDFLYERYNDASIDAVAGIESRGFLFGFPLAMRLGVPFVMIRKQGKLPYHKITQSYALEYGEATIEMHTDAIGKGQRVLIHDDLLATGGSASAAAALIQKAGGEVYGFNFLVALEYLKGDLNLQQYSNNIANLVRF